LKQAKGLRIAIVEKDKCKSSECNFECNRFCPIVRAGKNIVWLDEEGKAVIDELGCIACGICVVKCPFHAIEIVNLASEPNVPCIHQYGINSFRIYGLPTPKYGKAIGIIGMNGAGKSTALNILAGKIKPNLGILDREVSVDEIIERFRGKELQRYLKDLYDKKIKVVIKPQDIHEVANKIKGEVKHILKFVDENKEFDLISEYLSLNNFLNKNVKELSGGELQRFAIAIATLKDADVYLFDEPCSYLDVYQRLRLAKLLNYLLSKGKTLVLVEHDFAVLDYLCENICIIYGKPKVYGIVSLPYSTSEGINSYLEGYLPHENVRLRKNPVKFLLRSLERQSTEGYKILEWSKLIVKLDNFVLEAEGGYINKGEVIGILGPNGIGKTTFIKVLAGEIKTFEGSVYCLIENPSISYKPQVFDFPKPEILVKDFLNSVNPNYSKNEWIMEEIIYPLRIDQIYERYIYELSGGEKQALKITECLLKDADIYLFDEPSAFLDVEQRLAVAKILRKYAQTFKKAIFIVEHDLMIQDFACDSLIIFKGEPGIKGYSYEPLGLKRGFNMFLKDLGITFRRDQRTFRPRINKEDSWLDRKQKELGEYYYFGV
jgi:ATP-binding cassette subfamily E protein 1